MQPHASHVSLQKFAEYEYLDRYTEPPLNQTLRAGKSAEYDNLEEDFIDSACEPTLEDVLHGSLADENRRAAHRVSFV